MTRPIHIDLRLEEHRELVLSIDTRLRGLGIPGLLVTCEANPETGRLAISCEPIQSEQEAPMPHLKFPTKKLVQHPSIRFPVTAEYLGPFDDGVEGWFVSICNDQDQLIVERIRRIHMKLVQSKIVDPERSEIAWITKTTPDGTLVKTKDHDLWFITILYEYLNR